MSIKVLMEGLPVNISDLEESCPILILTKATKITRSPTTDVSTFPPGLMLHVNFAFFSIEIIRGFTLTFMSICYAPSYSFGFIYIGKRPPLEIFKLIFNALKN